MPSDKTIRIYCLHDAVISSASCKPFPKNPNIHSEKQISLLAKVISLNGWRNPIIISKRSGYITKGHGRLLAAKVLLESGYSDSIPVEYQEYSSEADELADIVADNRISELSSLDAILTNELMDLTKIDLGDGFDFGAFGFEERDFLLGETNWGDPLSDKKNPSHLGENDRAGRAIIKIQCPQGSVSALRTALTTLIPTIEGAEVL